MKAAIDEIGKQVQVLNTANEQLRAENEQLQKMLNESYDLLASFAGPEEEEDRGEEEKQADEFSPEF